MVRFRSERQRRKVMMMRRRARGPESELGPVVSHREGNVIRRLERGLPAMTSKARKRVEQSIRRDMSRGIDPEQAIAIALSKARAGGFQVPPPPLEEKK